MEKKFEKKFINKYVTEISTFCTVGKYPQKNIVEKIKKRYVKMQNFMLISEMLKNFHRHVPKKSYKPKCVRNFPFFNFY